MTPVARLFVESKNWTIFPKKISSKKISKLALGREKIEFSTTFRRFDSEAKVSSGSTRMTPVARLFVESKNWTIFPKKIWFRGKGLWWMHKDDTGSQTVCRVQKLNDFSEENFIEENFKVSSRSRADWIFDHFSKIFSPSCFQEQPYLQIWLCLPSNASNLLGNFLPCRRSFLKKISSTSFHVQNLQGFSLKETVKIFIYKIFWFGDKYIYSTDTK